MSAGAAHTCVIIYSDDSMYETFHGRLVCWGLRYQRYNYDYKGNIQGIVYNEVSKNSNISD